MNILFITANRIGDAVLSTGVLAHLVEKYPDARFTIACGPVAADLFRAVPRLDHLFLLRKEKRNGHWIKLWRFCVGQKWDLIVDLRNSFITRLLWAKKRAYRPSHSTGRHKVEDNAAALGLSPPPAPKIWLDAESEAKAAALIPANTKILALAPAANWPAKQWPVERFSELARRLTAGSGLLPNAKILIAAAPHEREQLAPLFATLPADRIIDTQSLDLLAIAACFAKAALFVGNDSGLMHVAASMGTPTLGLFGPGWDKIYGPWGVKAVVVRTPESSAELLARLPYAGAPEPNLMGGLTVDTVEEAARALLSRP
jgi:lipopolysaccharide export system permease protein